jgi:hypothetical protein
MFVARWTIWSKPVRKYVRSIVKAPLKSIAGYASKKVLIYVVVFAMSVASIFIWSSKWERMKGSAAVEAGMEINDGLYFSVVAIVVSFWSVVIAMIVCLIMPPVSADSSMKRGKDDLIKRIELARAQSNVDLLRELLREKASQDKELVTGGVGPDRIKERAFITKLHCVHMNSLILLYLPVLLYSASTWMFAHAMLYEG